MLFYSKKVYHKAIITEKLQITYCIGCKIVSEVFSFVSYLCDKITIQTSIDCDKIVTQTSIDVVFTFRGENCLRRTEVFRMKMFNKQN